jgi:type IV pilus assembly protein PilE
MRGFTLVELLVAMAVAGILAALALPGYSQLMTRASRQDARLALLRLQHRQESFFATRLRYAHTLGEGTDPPGLAMQARSDDGHYLLALQTAADGMAYIARARVDPVGRQANDTLCAQLSIDETGRRSSADASGIWRDDDPHRCWG